MYGTLRGALAGRKIAFDRDSYAATVDGRIGLPEDIGKAAVWLASDDADYVHGQSIFIDGGMTLYPEFARGG